MRSDNYDKGSEFRSVSWHSAGKDYVHYLGQEVTINHNKYGTKVLANVYSISEIAYIVDGTSQFINKIVIKVISKKGEIFNWIEVRNATNLVLMHSNEQYLGL